MSALTTIASTGVLMKVSVKFIARSVSAWHRGLADGTPASMLLRCGVRVVGRLHAIVDPHRYAILELDLTAAPHDAPLFQTLENRHLVAAGRPGRHEHLTHHQIVLADLWLRRTRLAAGLLRRRIRRIGILRGGRGLFLVGFALGLHHIHGLAVGVVDDRGLRERE